MTKIAGRIGLRIFSRVGPPVKKIVVYGSRKVANLAREWPNVCVKKRSYRCVLLEVAGNPG